MSLNVNNIYNMDCLDGIEQMDSSSVGLVVTDPPYDVSYDKKLKEYKSMNEDKKTLGVNKVHNMDCLDGFEKMDGSIIDLVVTDPDYDVNYANKSDEMSQIDGADRSKQIERDEHYVEFKNFNYMRFAFGLKNVLKNNSHVYIFCGDRQLFKWYEVMNYAGFKINDILIWVKNRQTFSLGLSYHYSYKHEYCMMWVKGSRKLRKAGLCTVMNYDIPKKYVHPTQKPLEMIEFLILNSSNEGDLILDPFMGSGTTAAAAKRLNRNFIGFELSNEYCDIANNRINGVNKKVDLFSFEDD